MSRPKFLLLALRYLLEAPSDLLGLWLVLFSYSNYRGSFFSSCFGGKTNGMVGGWCISSKPLQVGRNVGLVFWYPAVYAGCNFLANVFKIRNTERLTRLPSKNGCELPSVISILQAYQMRKARDAPMVTSRCSRFHGADQVAFFLSLFRYTFLFIKSSPKRRYELMVFAPNVCWGKKEKKSIMGYMMFA